MNRKDFFKTFFGGAAVAAVAPEIMKAADRSYSHRFAYPKFSSGGVVNWSETEELISATEAKIDHMALNKHFLAEADRRREMIEEAVRKWNSVFVQSREELETLYKP